MSKKTLYTMVDDTMTALRIMDQIDEYGDCWIWNGATSSGGYPIMKIYGCGCRLVRRVAFGLSGGVLAMREPVAVTCGERRCVNPDHLVASSMAEIGKAAGARGAFSGMARSAKIAAARREKAKLTIDHARVIRVSDESGPVLAARYNVNRSVINGIKNGTRWKDYANPFAGLMASNDAARRRA